MELDEPCLPPGVDEPEGVDSEALHHPVTPRERTVREDPHDHMRDLREVPDKVPEGVVCGGGLRHLVVLLRLDGVDEVGELDRVHDEEDRHVVADDVVVPFFRVELRREPPDIPDRIGRAPKADDGREPDEDRRLLLRVLQERRSRILGHRFVDLEIPVSARSPGVDDPLGDPLVVEVRQLLAEVKVLQKRRPPLPRLERVVGMAHPHPLVRRQVLALRVLADLIELLLFALFIHRPFLIHTLSPATLVPRPIVPLIPRRAPTSRWVIIKVTARRRQACRAVALPEFP
ncbi:hypothetical protein DSECCO2_562730 [anaerobic digester metagenome]